jgi:tetratricopeptide (TPR) repeat protein
MKSTSIAMFWDKITDEISIETTLGHPSQWRKKEIDTFNGLFIDKVIFQCKSDSRKAILCSIPKVQGNYLFDSISVSYDTLRRVLVKKSSQGTPTLREMFAIYIGEESVHSFMVKHQILKLDVPTTIDRKSRNLQQFNAINASTTTLLIEHIEDESEKVIASSNLFDTAKEKKSKNSLNTEEVIEQMQDNYRRLSNALSQLEVSRGVAAVKRYDYSLGAAHFIKSISLDDSHELAHLGLALCYFELRDYTEMLTVLNEAKCKDQRFKLILTALAYFNSGKNKDAIYLLQEKVTGLSKEGLVKAAPISITLGVLLASEGRLEEALQILRTTKAAIELLSTESSGSYYSCLFNLARVYDLQDKSNEAEKLYKKLLDAPRRSLEIVIFENSLTRLFFSKLLARHEKIEAAIAILVPNIDALTERPQLLNSPTFLSSLYDMANLQLANADYKESKKHFDKLWEVFSVIYGRDSLQAKLALSHIQFLKEKLS